MKPIALLALCTFLVACTRYPSTIRLTPEAENRRLAQGKQDRIEGVISHSDATYVYVDAHGVTEQVERKDIASVKNGASRAMLLGGIAIGAGVVTTVVSALYLECDQNEFPLACPFTHGKANFWAAFFLVTGVAVTFWGVRELLSGMMDKSRVANALEGGTAGLRLAPMPVAKSDGGVAPGVGLGLTW